MASQYPGGSAQHWSTMQLVGIVRCPIGSLTPYGKGRQLDPKAVQRLARRFAGNRRKKGKCRPNEKRNHIRGITTFEDLDRILAALNISDRALLSTALGEESEYPLLSGHRIACLDGGHRLAAAASNPDSATAWWVVQLFCVHGTWVDFPLKIGLPASTTADIRSEVEYYSHETRYSDGDLFTMIWESRLQKETDREEEYWDRLTDPKAVNLKGFLRNNSELARALYALSRFPGVIWGLQLGNVHKYPPYLIDDHILYHLQYILRVWNYITDEDPRVMACVCSTSVRNLQLRAPAASQSDRRVIRQMCSEGTVFPKLTDLDLRRRVEERILSLDLVIPSVETFHENMKYFMIGARILRRYLLDEEPEKPGPGDVDKRRRTLFERLSEDWTAPPVQYLEVGVGKFAPLAVSRTTAHLAYIQMLVAALRNFACLDDAHPRQDRRGEKLPAGPVRSWVVYLLELARRQGFDNQKIRDGLAGQSGKDGEEAFEPKRRVLADWRGGTPFTKTYLSLQQEAFLHKLAVPMPSMDKPTPAYIFKDILNAFVDRWGLVVTQLDIDAFMPPAEMETRAPPETLAPNSDPAASSQSAEKTDDEMEDVGDEPRGVPTNARHAPPGAIRTTKKSTRQGPLKQRNDTSEHRRPERVVETLLHKKFRHALGSTIAEPGTSLDALPALPPSPPSNPPQGTAANIGAPTPEAPISGPTTDHNQIQSAPGAGRPEVGHVGVSETIIHKATRHALGTSAVFPGSLPLPPSPLAQNVTSTDIQGGLPGAVDESLVAPVNERSQSSHIQGSSVNSEGLSETILHSTTRHALEPLDSVSFAPAPTAPPPPQLGQATRRRLQSNDIDLVPTRKPQARIEKANRSDKPKKSATKLRKEKPHAPGDLEDLPDAPSPSALQADADVVNTQMQDAADPALISVDQVPPLDSVDPSSLVPMTNLGENTNMAFQDSSLPVEGSVIDVPSEVSPPEQSSTMMSTAIGETSFDFDATEIDFRMTNGNDRQGRLEQKLRERRKKKPAINAAAKANVSKQPPPASKNTLPRRRGKRVPIPEPVTEVRNAPQAASDLPPAVPELVQSSATMDQATSGVSQNVSTTVDGPDHSQVPQTTDNTLLNVEQAAVGNPSELGPGLADGSTSIEPPQLLESVLAEVETARGRDGMAGLERGTTNVSTYLGQAGVSPETNLLPQASTAVPVPPSVAFGELTQLQFAPSVSGLAEMPASPGPIETLPSRIRPRHPARSRSIQPIRKMKGQRTATLNPTVENETASHVADDDGDYTRKPSATDVQSNPKRGAVYINPKREIKWGGVTKKVRDDGWTGTAAIPAFKDEIRELREQIAANPQERENILAKTVQAMVEVTYEGSGRKVWMRLLEKFGQDLDGLVNFVGEGPTFWAYVADSVRPPEAPDISTAGTYQLDDAEDSEEL